MMVATRRSRARDVGIILVLALLAVDAVLVAMALRSPPAPPEVTVAADPPPVATTEPVAEPTPTETPTPTPEPVAAATARELPLSVLDADRAVRSVEPGTCADGGGVVELTEDGGVTWEPTAPAELAVVRVRLTATSLFFIGAGPDCSEEYVQGGDGGASWEPTGDSSGAWHLSAAADSAEIHAPDGFVPSPCGDAVVVDLEAADQSASALCADGTVQRTDDSGATWSAVGVAPGARAMGMRSGVPLVAAIGVEGCTGLALQEVSPNGLTDVSCVDGATEVGVALAFSPDGQAGYLLSDGVTYTSADGGTTWSPAA